MRYEDFLKTKEYRHIEAGFEPDQSLFPVGMFDFQRDCAAWACRRGRAALFLDTGLGKTLTQLSWAVQVVKHMSMPVLVVAPLCVAQQTVKEAQKFGIDAEYIRDEKDATKMIQVTNYEMLKNFHSIDYGGIVLDESSILKGMDGRMRKYITEFAQCIPYRLSCTATPSPNDYMELGTQSEFLGVMSQVEMLATFFIHDGSDTSKWRLKGHGVKKFWEWVSTWAVIMRHPADLGYSAEGYDLPPVQYHEHIVETQADGALLVEIAKGLQERNKARKETVDQRVAKAAEIANSISEPCIIWCHLNEEAEKLAQAIGGSVNVHGSMKPDDKENWLNAFTDGTLEKLITKPKIAGFGMNWQHCRNMIFVGLSDSWESYYQAIRRCWRFGQDKTVSVHIVSSDREGAVLENIRRKENQNNEMREQMAKITSDITRAEIQSVKLDKSDYKPVESIKFPSFL